jgi:hypothetical protein
MNETFLTTFALRSIAFHLTRCSVEKAVVFSNLTQLVEFQDGFQERINTAIQIEGKTDDQAVLLDSVVKVCVVSDYFSCDWHRSRICSSSR